MKIKKAKFVKAEYSYDGAWLTIQYTTNQKKPNVNGLKKPNPNINPIISTITNIAHPFVIRYSSALCPLEFI